MLVPSPLSISKWYLNKFYIFVFKKSLTNRWSVFSENCCFNECYFKILETLCISFRRGNFSCSDIISQTINELGWLAVVFSRFLVDGRGIAFLRVTKINLAPQLLILSIYPMQGKVYGVKNTVRWHLELESLRYRARTFYNQIKVDWRIK